jgi:beta-N-acetylhexosaminidase
VSFRGRRVGREAGALCALGLMLGGCGMERGAASRSAPQAARSARPARADDARSRKLARPSAPASAARHEQARALERLVGQKLMVSYRGTVDPPRELLDRITRGEVGSVILFKENVPADGAAGVRRNISRLQDAARRGRNPPLLIATDQEGGAVRRMPGPPDRSARQLGAQSVEAVRAAGRQTGRSLRRMGIRLDLAPVADLPVGHSFLGDRTFSTDAERTAAASTAFAAGLQSSGVAATAKHYPGLGSAGQANTDLAAVTVGVPRSALDRERAGFVRHVDAGTRVVMVSNAVYAAYDPRRPAVASRRILGRLRTDGFQGVVISDDLNVPGLRRFGDAAARMATNAGVDVLMFASGDGTSAYRALLHSVRSGAVDRSLVRRQVRRIIDLKRWIAGRPPVDGT